MNIGIICYDLSRNGGSEKVAINLFNSLNKFFDNVELISLFCEHDSAAMFNITNYKCVTNHKGSFLRDFTCTFRELNKFIKEKNIDVVLSIGMNAAIYTCLLKNNSSLRAVICEHSNISNKMYNSFRQNIKRIIATNCADKIVVLTDSDCNEYKKRYPKSADKFTYIYNWIEDNWFDNELDYDMNSKKIITVCRLDRVKGIERSIEAAEIVFAKHKDWQWHIYGSGDDDYLKELKQLVIEKKLENNFIFMGPCYQLTDVYPQYSIYVCTSYYEGLPISLLEAKTKKLPIISFDIKTGPNEIIKNEINGFLVKDGDVDSLANALMKLVEDETLRFDFSSKSMIDIEKFSKSTIEQKWVELINEVTNQTASIMTK